MVQKIVFYSIHVISEYNLSGSEIICRQINEMLNPLCIPVAGTVWTYGIYGDYSSDTTAENYCHYTAYMVAFVLITIAWCIIGLALALSFCACCCACIAMCLTAK